MVPRNYALVRGSLDLELIVLLPLELEFVLFQLLLGPQRIEADLGVVREPNPPDLLLVLRNHIHREQHVQCIVDPPANVFLVVEGETRMLVIFIS